MFGMMKNNMEKMSAVSPLYTAKQDELTLVTIGEHHTHC